MQKKRLHILETLIKALKPMTVFAETDPTTNEPTHTEPPAPKEPSAPKKPTIDIAAAIEAARTEERNKLYGTIESLKADKNRLYSDLTEANKSVVKLQKDLEKAQAVQEGFSATKEKVTQYESSNQTLQAEVDRLTKELEDANKRYESRENELTVAKVKDSILAEYQGQVIEELITGSTEEEIRQSAEAAHERYKAIVQSVNPTAVVAPQPSMPKPNPNPSQLRQTHQSPSVDLSQIDLSTQAGRDQFAKMRAELGLK